MKIEIVPQFELGNVFRLRVGDVLNNCLSDPIYQQFRFAVAYMRLSGLERLGASLDSLLNRGGKVSGAIGIDDAITSLEALEALSDISSTSTIIHTVTGFIYHPKVYLINGDHSATIIIGSANLTRDGLFRNMEFATALHLDFNIAEDLSVYEQFDIFFKELLNLSYPNNRLIEENLLKMLVEENYIKSEVQVKEPGPNLQNRRQQKSTNSPVIAALFPPISIPVAPPMFKKPGKKKLVQPVKPIVKVVNNAPTVSRDAEVFIMRLSPFDSSHRSGVKGTAEMLIPLAANSFFPPLTLSGRKHPDAFFDVILNTPFGPERHSYRCWSYAGKDELRLRMDKDTMDLINTMRGDLLVINKLIPSGSLLYEITILSPDDPNYNLFLEQCKYVVSDSKRWGIINS